jgi:hypothetical protein
MTVGTDTYVTAAEADAIITAWLPSSDAQRAAWAALSTADKEAYLLQAAAWIEGLPFSGCIYSLDQQMQFPRDYNDTGEVPDAVKKAQALEAAASVGMTAQAAKRAQLRAMGVTSFSAGSLSETYGALSGNGLFSPMAAQLLRRYQMGGVPFA